MTTTNVLPNAVSLPDMVTLTATEVAAPPAWALLQRQLIALMEQAAEVMMAKYADPGGIIYFADDIDDLYERVYNWSLFYALGADRHVHDLALRSWNAMTRACASGRRHPFYLWYLPQTHNEYYGLTVPPGERPSYRAGRRWISDWHHQSEGNMAFYHFGLADPTSAENVSRARRFAAMFMGEDPAAPNYDPRYKIIRSPIHGSTGPFLHANAEEVIAWLEGGKGAGYRYYGVRATLHPVIEALEQDWEQTPARRDEIIELFDDIVLNGDIPNTLGATALVTNAYLYTGDEKYKRWVLEYVDVWLDRMRRNGGIMPDNVGPTGKIGEQRGGQWWGGLYGWYHFGGFNVMFHSLTVAAECALLLSGDFGYLELLRSQLRLLLRHARTRDDGQLLVPHKHGPHGWEDFRPLRMQELAHLYHASLSPEDHALIAQVRAGERERDWNQVPSEGEKNSGNTEFARFQYYDGRNPSWPEDILRAEYQLAVETLTAMRRDERDVATLIAENRSPPHAVLTKGLTQVALGAPESVYNGGLLRATVRYFDPHRARPGLPPDVSALVDTLSPDRVGIQLVNTGTSATRTVIVQAGAFGEHQFTEIRYREELQAHQAQDPRAWLREERTHTVRTVPVNGTYCSVWLPPATTIRLDMGLRRFVNQPTYAFPWHGGCVPLPQQEK